MTSPNYYDKWTSSVLQTIIKNWKYKNAEIQSNLAFEIGVRGPRFLYKMNVKVSDKVKYIALLTFFILDLITQRSEVIA